MELPSISKITSKQLQIVEISLTSIGFLVHHRFPQLSPETPGKKKRTLEMGECSSLCCKAGTGPHKHHQNTALPKRELSEPVRFQSYIIPFSGGLLSPDGPERAQDTPLCSRSLLYPKPVWLTTAVTPDGKGHLASLCNAPLGRSDRQLELNDLLTQLMAAESLFFLLPPLFLSFSLNLPSEITQMIHEILTSFFIFFFKLLLPFLKYQIHNTHHNKD